MVLVAHACCSSTTLSPEFHRRASCFSFCRLSYLQLPARFLSPNGCDFENGVERRTRRGRTTTSGVELSELCFPLSIRSVYGVFEKHFSERLKEERCHGNGVKRNIRRNSSTAIQALDVKKKGKGEILHDSNERQAEPKTNTLKNGAYLDAVLKVYCTHIEPDYSLPWQKRKRSASTRSAFVIGDKKLLTNAHCVRHGTQVKVKKKGDDRKYIATVLAIGVDCDLALLSVDNEEFWDDVVPVVFGKLPQLQASVTMVGYPVGGDTISVTKGVVSRIEVTSYGLGSTVLLGILIDAAINSGNSGGPAFNSRGQCIGVAFQALRSGENIGYVIPASVVSHFLTDYERNGNYTGFPCLGVLLQRLENPAMRSYLKASSTEGVLVRRVEPTSSAYGTLKEGDILVTFNGTRIGWEGTVQFRLSERIALGYLISRKFSGDVVELGLIRNGDWITVQTTVSPRAHLVPYHIENGQPSYLIVSGLVFTPLSNPFIDEEGYIGIKLLAKARYSSPRFKGEQIVILSQVLENETNIGYEHMSIQQVLKFNGTEIKNIHHLAHLVDTCKDKYLVFEFEGDFLAVLEKESAMSASSSILEDFGIASERSADLFEPYVDHLCENHSLEKEFGDSPVSNAVFGLYGVFWA
ncbi:Protease Do-like 2, chloroplastic-like protein [Drosera capensis]